MYKKFIFLICIAFQDELLEVFNLKLLNMEEKSLKLICMYQIILSVIWSSNVEYNKRSKFK